MQFPTDFEITPIDPEKVPDDFYIWQVTSDEELEQMRREWKGSAYSWRRFIEREFPNKDPKEEFAFKRKLAKKREIANCGKWQVYKKAKDGKLGYRHNRCKHYAECEGCAEWRKQTLVSRMVNIANPTLSEKKPDGGKEIYWRVKLDDKEVYITSGGEGEPVSYSKMQKIAEQNKVPPKGFRYSGNLGTEPSPKQDTEGKAKVKRRPAIVEAPPEIARKIEEQASEEAWPLKSPETEEELQAAITAFERRLSELCEQHPNCEGIHYLNTETVYIDMKEVNWQKPPG